MEEYYQEMEVLTLRAGYRDENDGNIFRFFNGLRREIKEQCNVLPYNTLTELVELAKKVEANLKAKFAPRTPSQPV